MKKLLKKEDLIIIITVLLIAASLAAHGFIKKNELTAYIYINGEVTEKINLNSVKNNYTFTTDTMPKTEITVESGAIYFSKSECSDKICVNSGKLVKNGQAAACLPARVVIAVKNSGGEPDMLTY